MGNQMECTLTKEQKVKKIKCKKMFFLKAFIISLILLVASAFICIAFHEPIMGMVTKLYGIEPHYYSLMVGLLLGMWKILIIQFTLVPFLVLLCVQKHIEKSTDE